jgi:coniferyl-aldehyde dehydrogenase
MQQNRGQQRSRAWAASGANLPPCMPRRGATRSWIACGATRGWMRCSRWCMTTPSVSSRPSPPTSATARRTRRAWLELFPSAWRRSATRARHVAGWMKPQRKSPSLLVPARPRPPRSRQPLGVVGIIVPWNYPLMLASLAPGGGAGGRQPRDAQDVGIHAAHRRSCWRSLVTRELFPPDEVAVVQWAMPRSALPSRRLPFDHLLFTGSTRVGHDIMRMRGRPPDPGDAGAGRQVAGASSAPDYPLAPGGAERIVAGKLLNAGQTCIAPDYVLLPAGRRAGLRRCWRAPPWQRGASRTWPRTPDYSGHRQ